MAGGTLHFEDVTEGDEAPATSHTLTRTDLVRYAGASGDYNPMHHDEIAATAAGQPSVFGHGMFSMGLLGTALTDYVGAGNVTALPGPFQPSDVAGRGAHHQDRRYRQAGRGRAATSSTSSAAWPTPTARSRWWERRPPSCPAGAETPRRAGAGAPGVRTGRAPTAQKAPNGGTPDLWLLKRVDLLSASSLGVQRESRFNSPAGCHPCMTQTDPP